MFVLDLLRDLGVDSTYFICLGIFVLTYFVVRQIALKPTSDLIVERDSRIDGRSQEIDKLEGEVERVKKDLTIQRSAAQREASDRFKNIKADALEEQKKLIFDSREKASREIKALKEKLHSEVVKEKELLKKEIPSLGAEIFKNMIQSNSSQSGKSSKGMRTGV